MREDLKKSERQTFRLVTILILIGAFYAPTVGAQQIDYDRSRYNSAAYYKYQEAGDITILVNVWGSVQSPGLYEIPRGTQLNWLFSAAGGPTIGATSWGDDRELTVRLLRSVNGQNQVVFETVMNDEVFIPEQNPVLQDGDILVVEKYTRPIFTWRDVFPVVSATSTVISVVLLLTR